MMAAVGSLFMRNLTVLMNLNAGDTLQIRNASGAARLLNDQSTTANSICAYMMLIKLN
jgi:hypothetical protein